MGGFRVGMKVYSSEWYSKYGLDYKEAARSLKDLGVSFVVAQSALLPPTSGTSTAGVSRQVQERAEHYDDVRFRRALEEGGIEYWLVFRVFFDPASTTRYGNIPVDGYGRPMEKVDWYIGACPSDGRYLEDRLACMEKAVDVLRPDGLLVTFIRFPGFWEGWLPETRRDDWPEYCFCPRCLGTFESTTGLSIPSAARVAPGRWIGENVYPRWVEWKCSVIRDTVEEVKWRAGHRHPGIRIMLNTVPLGDRYFRGAGREVFGQDWAKLAEATDIFEVMAYHQILKRPVEWITETGLEVKAAVRKPVVCTIQARPMYTEGIHATGGRKTAITVEEFDRVLRQLKVSGLDGVVLFHWADFLDQPLERRDTSWVESIRAAAQS